MQVMLGLRKGNSFYAQISNKTFKFAESVIRRMTRIADEHGAINLSQGFPDFDPPKELMQALKKAAQEGPHQYEITFGSKTFREALAIKQGNAIDRDIDPETEIVITCGATEAMICAMMSVLNPGDKVGIFSPYYENYHADAIITGAEAVFIPLVPPEYNVDWQALETLCKWYKGAGSVQPLKPLRQGVYKR